MSKPYVIGICGGSGSGKSFFLRQLKGFFKEHELSILTYDNYYLPLHLQKVDNNGIPNFDLPTAIDTPLFLKDLQALVNGNTIYKEEYNFNNPAVQAKIIEVKPAPIIILEGLFIFCNKELFNQIDLKIFIDASTEVKLERRLQRDQQERGYGAEDVLYRTHNHVATAFAQYIEPYQHDSDIVIPNNKDFTKSIQVIAAFLKTKIEELK